MDAARFDRWTRGWDERMPRRGLGGLAVGALLALGVTDEFEAKRKKKKKAKKKKSATGGESICVDKNHCGTEGTFEAQCGDHFNTVPCFCYRTLDGNEPYCGSGASAVSPIPENNLCLNGGCVNQGGACVDMTGCTFGPVGCTLPCPNPW